MTIEDLLAQMTDVLSDSISSDQMDPVMNELASVFTKLKARATPCLELMEYLNDESDWLSINAMGSDKNLIQYSLSVTKEMLDNASDSVTEESCTLVGLFHAIGMAKFGDDELQTVEGEDPEIARMKLGSRSLQILADFTPVEPFEAQAVLYQCVDEIPVDRIELTDLLTNAIKKCA